VPKAGRKTVLHKSLTKRNKVIKQRKKEAAKSDSEQKAKPRKVTKLLHKKKRSKEAEEKQENRDEEPKTDESGSGEETEDTDTEHGDHEPNGGDAAPPRHRAAPSLSSQGSSFLDNAKVPFLFLFACASGALVWWCSFWVRYAGPSAGRRQFGRGTGPPQTAVLREALLLHPLLMMPVPPYL
jgi:hypothetical protein